MKQLLINRLKIVGFIFALVGWLMLITVPLEQLFNKDLTRIESVFETNSFKWGLRILILFLLVILFKWQQQISNLVEAYNYLQITAKIILIGGVIGWVVGLGSLLL